MCMCDMICPLTKFHVPGCNCLLIILSVSELNKIFARLSCCYVQQKQYLFLQHFYRASLQGPEISGVSLPLHKLACLPCSCYWYRKSEIYGSVVASSSMFFMWISVWKSLYWFSSLNGAHKQHGVIRRLHVWGKNSAKQFEYPTFHW